MSMNAPVPMPVVPARLRFVLYWTSYFLSMAAGLLSAGWQIIAAASPDVAAPLWIKLAPALMLLIVAQLNGLSGNNVTGASTVVARREEGAIGLLYAGAILAVLGLVLLLATAYTTVGIILLIVGVVMVVLSVVRDRV